MTIDPLVFRYSCSVLLRDLHASVRYVCDYSHTVVFHSICGQMVAFPFPTLQGLWIYALTSIEAWKCPPIDPFVHVKRNIIHLL